MTVFNDFLKLSDQMKSPGYQSETSVQKQASDLLKLFELAMAKAEEIAASKDSEELNENNYEQILELAIEKFWARASELSFEEQQQLVESIRLLNQQVRELTAKIEATRVA